MQILRPLSPVSSLSRLTASHGKSHPSVVRDPAPTASGQSLSSVAAAHSAAFSRIQSHGSSLHKSRLKDMRNEEHMERTHTDYIQSRAEVRAIFLNVDKPLAEKSPRPGHSRVTAIHQNTRGLPSFEGYKVPL